ncbi:MAG: PAS domain S-box protein, partial [Candidatus Thermoplasmatota archaeon]|nr:PAS domain S-box protein [Candidatus Thermoplasmatota archaeon]
MHPEDRTVRGTSLDTDDGNAIALFDASPQPVAIFSQGHIRYANDACAKLVGLSSAKEVIGASLDRFVGPGTSKDLGGFLDQRAEQGSDTFSEVLFTAAGEPIHVHLATLPIRFQGEPAHLVYLDDVTEHE